jgi:hypothetical protein
MITTSESALRNRLVEAGIPHALAHDPNRGAYLASLLGRRLEGDKPSVSGAAQAAGITTDLVRQWRHRSPAFATAEHRARYGSVSDLTEIEADAPPEPERVKELRERHRRAVEICRDLGPGPWPGTRQTRAWKTGVYNSNRETAIETAQALGNAGVNDHLLPDPPPARPYPRQRRRPVSFWGPR